MSGLSTSSNQPKFRQTDLFRMSPSCSLCKLHEGVPRPCLGGRGSHEARFVFLADSPSWGDQKEGVQWSERKFGSILRESGISLDDCYFTSLLKCPLMDKQGTKEHVSHCLHYVMTELSAIKPKVIFVTGKLAYQTLTRVETKDSIGKLRGSVHTVKMPWGDVGIIATWSPGYARHKDAAAQDIISDILTGISFLAPPRKVDYRWINDPDELIHAVDCIIDLYRSGKLEYGFLAIDTESNNLIHKDVSPVPYPLDHNIATIQVCWNPGKAFAVPVIRKDSVFNNEYNIVVLRTQIQRLLEEIPVVGQNYKFDELYFNVKLGLTTKKFIFDTMLAHHFLHGGSLPNNLGFMTARILGWASHKKDIEAELAAMPDDDRRYSNLTVQTILDYGCRDADCTLHIAKILMERMRAYRYAERFPGVPVIYETMYDAYMARAQFPWRPILDIEKTGALVDIAKAPDVSAELQARMDEAYSTITSSPPYAVWLLDHTKPNPKRRTYTKKAEHYIKCEKCNYEAKFPVEGKRPKKTSCPRCTAEVVVRYKMVNTDKFVVNESEPETVFDPINLRSPQQVSKFFYSQRYLGLPQIEGMEDSTDKAARAALLDICEREGKVVHAKVLVAIGDYNKASKLFTAYATKLPTYLFVTDPNKVVSDAVTSRFEESTGVNHIHVSFYQDGTVSGRLCVSGDTRIVTDHGLVSIESIGNDVSKPYHVYTHTGSWKRITAFYIKGTERMLRISSGGGSISCTGGHRILTDRGWRCARDVSVGDRVLSYNTESLNIQSPLRLREAHPSSKSAQAYCRWSYMDEQWLSEEGLAGLNEILQICGPAVHKGIGLSKEQEGFYGEDPEQIWCSQTANKEFTGSQLFEDLYRVWDGSLLNSKRFQSISLGGIQQLATLRSSTSEELVAENMCSKYGYNEGIGDILSWSYGDVENRILLEPGEFYTLPLPTSSAARDGEHVCSLLRGSHGVLQVEGIKTAEGKLVSESRGDVAGSCLGGSQIELCEVSKNLKEQRCEEERERCLQNGFSGRGLCVCGGGRELPCNERRSAKTGCREGRTSRIHRETASPILHPGCDKFNAGSNGSDFFLCEVTSIEDIGDRLVYDISVDEDESYCAEGFVNHNSSRRPSLHTIPRKSSIKRLFISRFGDKGLVLQNDLSQAEVRAFVIETGDESLRDAFLQGIDPYIKMASNTYSIPLEKVTDDMRQDNKSIVLGLLFGRGAVAISEQIKKDVQTVRGIIASFFGGMPKLKNWIDKQHKFVDSKKCAISRFGRVRPLVDQIEADDDEMLNHAHNISVNHPIQGMVGDLCIDSVARIWYALKERGLRSVIFNTVHDSTIVDLYLPEILEVMPLIRAEMFTKLPDYFPWINVPFAIDQELGLSWGASVKSSLDGNLLTMKGNPSIIHSCLLRLRNCFRIDVVSADAKPEKDGSSSLTFKARLVAC